MKVMNDLIMTYSGIWEMWFKVCTGVMNCAPLGASTRGWVVAPVHTETQSMGLSLTEAKCLGPIHLNTP